MTRFAPQPKRLPALLGFGLAWVLLNFFLTIDFPLPGTFTLKPLPVSYTHLTLPTNVSMCISRWSPYH